MKVIGAFAALIGLVLFVLAVLAYSELRTAATSATSPSPDSLPLTEIICPELFAPGHAGTKPAALARIAMNRIYMLSVVAVALFGGGVYVLFMGESTNRC